MYPHLSLGHWQVWRSVAAVTALVVTALLATSTVVVESGDTLSAIAARHDVSVAELIEWNDIEDPDRIFRGERLIVSAPTGDAAAVASTAGNSHVVTAGETLGGIAHRYGSSVAALVAANELDNPNRIFEGQELRIGAEPTTTAPPAAARSHLVAPGDTLHEIAAAYGTTAGELARINNLANADRIAVGAVLAIDGSSGPTPVTTTVPTTTVPTTTPATPAVPATTVPTTTVPPTAEPRSTARGAEDVLLTPLFDQWAATYGVPQALLEAIAWKESGWDQDAVSPSGQLGIMQLGPATIELIEGGLLGRDLDPLSASDGIQMGARFLRYLLDRTSTEEEAVAAWRQGLSSVLRDGINTSGANYVSSVAEIRDLRS